MLTIRYDGSAFHGWQRQPDKRTVQGTLEEALSKFCDQKITIDGTSRTDAGVHAYGQRASFKGDFGIPTDKIKLAVNNYLQGGMNQLSQTQDVEIIDVKEMPLSFHARFDSKGKTYRYVISNEAEPDIFRRNYAYFVREKLNIDLMREGAKYIVGTHDFKSFEASGSQERETTVRTVSELTIERSFGLRPQDDMIATSGQYRNCHSERSEESDIIIEITGDGFLYNMVRIIVGTLVEVGLEKKKPEDVKNIIEKKDRTFAGHTAPAAGLYLKEIYY